MDTITNGSAKQIAWAEKIRAQIVAVMRHNLNVAEKLAPVDDDADVQRRADIIRARIAHVESMTDAKTIIDARNWEPHQFLRDGCNAVGAPLNLSTAYRMRTFGY